MPCGNTAFNVLPEILTLIFEELVFDDTNIVPYPPPSEDWILFPRNHHPCLPLSHVCRWFEFISERAMNTPLILRMNVETNDEFVDLDESDLPLEDCLKRFKEIHLESNTLYRASWRVRDLIDRDAPLLEVLEVRLDPEWDLDLPLGINIIMTPDTKPRLRSLRLIGCAVDLSCLFSSTLQELFVDLEDGPSFHSVPAGNLLRSLSKLPSLRSLDLRFVLKSRDNDLDPPSTDLIAVHLPHLTHFYFAVGWWTQLLLIQYIVAPKLESLQLRCSQDFNRTSVPSTALVPLCPRLPSAPPLQVSLDLNRLFPRSVFRAVFSAANSTTDAYHLTDFQIKFSSDDGMPFERDICQSLPFVQPTLLSVAALPSEALVSLTPLSIDIHPFLTRVEEVYLGDTNALNTISFIAGIRDVSGPMPFPALRHLSLFIEDEGVST